MMRPYAKYKDSGVEWIGQIPEDWQIRKISRSFNLIKSGTTPSSDVSSYYEEGTINWIQSGDLNDGVLLETKKKITESALKACSALQIYPKGSLVIAMYGATIGRSGLMDFDGCCNQACCVLNVSKYFLIKYLYYWFLGNKLNIVQLSSGGGQPNISQDVIRNLKIPCPNMSEQKNAVRFLDDKILLLEELIAKKERMIELLKEQRAAVINEAVTKGLPAEERVRAGMDAQVKMKDSGVEWIGEVPEHWEVLPLYSMLKERDNKNIGNTENNLLSLSYGNIKRKDINSDFGLLPESFENYNIIEQGDIVIRPTDLQNDKRSLRCGYVNEKGIITSAYLTLMTGQKSVNTKFMYYLLHDYDVMKVFYSLGGGVRQGLIFEDIKRMPILVPSLEEQKSIVQYIDLKLIELDGTLVKEQKSISFLKEYRTTLISEVVTGKIDLS